MGALLIVDELRKYFDVPNGKLHAVDGVSFKIAEGRTLGVVGESGCGKSTLGRTIIHLLNPTSGRIVFDGKDISALGKKGRRELLREMQFIFQDPYSSLNPRMTVIEIIMEPFLIDGMRRSEARTEALKMMDTVGLAGRLETSYPHELDGGRRQRIGIARALALKPRFIICDEPVSALDVSIQAQVLNLIMDLQDELGLTYMFISHDLSVVKHISDDIMVMYLGKMVEMADAETLFRNPSHPYTQALLAAVPSIDIDDRRPSEVLPGEISSPINPKPGCRFADRCRRSGEKCAGEDPRAREVEPGHFVYCHYL